MCIFSVERHFHSAVVVTPGIVILEVFILTGPKMNMVGTFDYNSLCLHWLFKTQSVDSLFPCLAGHTVCWYPVSMSRWSHSDTLFTEVLYKQPPWRLNYKSSYIDQSYNVKSLRLPCIHLQKVRVGLERIHGVFNQSLTVRVRVIEHFLVLLCPTIVTQTVALLRPRLDPSCHGAARAR